MTKNNYWYLVLAPFALWVLDEIFVFRPAFFFVSLGLGMLVITLSVRALMKNRSQKFWPVFIIAPALFFLSFSFYSAIITSHFWMQAIFLLIVWYVFYFLKNIYYFYSFGAPEREEKLRRLMLSGSFLSAFAVSSVLFGLPIFLSWSFLLLLLMFIVICAALFGQFLIFSGRTDREQIIFLAVNTLVLSEFAGVLFLLPLNFNILGLLTAVVFYFLLLINNWRLENRLTYHNLKWPAAASIIISILLLLTARWL